MMNFIKTTDAETANKLRAQGFTEITDNSMKGVFCFLNNEKLRFEGKGKVTYTNTLNM